MSTPISTVLQVVAVVHDLTFAPGALGGFAGFFVAEHFLYQAGAFHFQFAVHAVVVGPVEVLHAVHISLFRSGIDTHRVAAP